MRADSHKGEPMKRIGMGAMVLALAAPAFLAAESPPGGLGGPDPPRLTRRGGFTPPRRKAGASKTTLARAIEIALLEVPGEALQAKIELENGKAIVEVTVFAQGRMVEVEIDGETGRVLEVEAEDGEDDDGPNGARGVATPVPRSFRYVGRVASGWSAAATAAIAARAKLRSILRIGLISPPPAETSETDMNGR